MKTIFQSALAICILGMATFSPISAASAAQPTATLALDLSHSHSHSFLTLTPEQILTAAHQQYWYDQITYAELQQQYADGICTITPTADGYRVKAGGLGTVDIWDDI